MQSLNPAALRDHHVLYRTLMFGPSPLSRTEREAIAVEVSRTNECHYWIEHHGAALRPVEKDGVLVDAVIRGHHELLPPRLRTLREYAARLTRTPAAVTRADVDAVRAARYTDEAVLHAALSRSWSKSSAAQPGAWTRRDSGRVMHRILPQDSRPIERYADCSRPHVAWRAENARLVMAVHFEP